MLDVFVVVCFGCEEVLELRNSCFFRKFGFFFVNEMFGEFCRCFRFGC